jgi:hypothetical protein
MIIVRNARSRWRRVSLGFMCGLLVGTFVLTGGVFGAAVDSHSATTRATVEPGLRDILHTPPLLVQPGRGVALRYDGVCQSDAFGSPCALAGSVFVRDSGELPYRRVSLTPAGDSALTASLGPITRRSSGISYYAVIDDGSGSSITVPAGGALAPQRAWTVPAVTPVDLGPHTFGRTREPDGRSVIASWGDGAGALGLIAGRAQAPIGPSAFDVSPTGSITVLDQVNHRLAVYPESFAGPRYLPIVFTGGEGDLAVGADETTYVLDHAAEPVVRAYTPTGALAGFTRIDDRGADMLRTGPGGAFVHAFPGDMWLPVGGPGLPLGPAAQAAGARAGRTVGGGAQVIVHAGPAEAFFALVADDRVLRAWRIGSTTTLGEVQLAEPLGAGMLVVLRVWTETDAEFLALVLTPRGLATSFALDADEWADSAALGRFRLHEDTLYQLRSAPSGAEIVTYDLGGTR